MDVDAIFNELEAENVLNVQPNFTVRLLSSCIGIYPQSQYCRMVSLKFRKIKSLTRRGELSPGLIFAKGNQGNMYSGGTWYKSNNRKTEWVKMESLRRTVVAGAVGAPVVLPGLLQDLRKQACKEDKLINMV